jgi:hypothetical protein
VERRVEGVNLRDDTEGRLIARRAIAIARRRIRGMRTSGLEDVEEEEGEGKGAGCIAAA